MNEIMPMDDGWCCNWRDCGCNIFVGGVRLDGVMLCVPCGARQVGLPADSTAEQVVAEANRRAVA